MEYDLPASTVRAAWRAAATRRGPGDEWPRTMVGKLGFRLTSGRELYENGEITLFEYSALPQVDKTKKQFWQMADGNMKAKYKFTLRAVNRVTWRVWAHREHMAAFRICRFLRDTTCNPVYAACRRRLELEAMDLDFD